MPYWLSRNSHGRRSREMAHTRCRYYAIYEMPHHYARAPGKDRPQLRAREGSTPFMRGRCAACLDDTIDAR